MNQGEFPTAAKIALSIVGGVVLMLIDVLMWLTIATDPGIIPRNVKFF